MQGQLCTFVTTVGCAPLHMVCFPCSPKYEFDEVCCNKDDSSADEYGMSSL